MTTAHELYEMETVPTTGSLTVLNVGLGDIEIVFNQFSPEEIEKALRMLQDMQARGYAILIRLDDGSYVRATAIDAERGRYIVQLPEGVAEPAESEPVSEKPRRGRPPGRKRAIPVGKAHATGVARSAGG